MKKINILLVVCSLLSWNLSFGINSDENISVGNRDYTLSTIISYNLPVLYVQTVDNEEPTCDYVSAPPGCMGASIANATKVPGRLVIFNYVNGIDSVVYDSGDYQKDVSGMTIKLRGNTSAYQDKKPYKIKLQKKFDLLFRGDDNTYKDKEWLLLKDDYFMTVVGLHVNEMVGMVWTPRHHFVNLIINNRYRGIYLLCESVKRNPDCRLDVDKNSGYIFEYDPYWWNEDVYVQSSSAPAYNYTFKYPESEDILPEQLEYMSSLVSRYEQSVRNGTYDHMIDVASFARWCLVHDIMGTNDAGGANMFYTKYDSTATTPIVAPLAWDFDMSERTESAWSASHIQHMAKFFNSSNRCFVAEFVKAWVELRKSLVSDMATYLRYYNNSDEGRAIEASSNINKIVYGYQINGPNNVAWRNYWISSRFNWLDTKIMAMNPLGDVNVNGTVDVSDVTALINMILNGADYVPWSADMDDDGVINVADVTALIAQILNN